MLAPVDSKLCPNLLLDGDLIGVGQWAAQHHVDQDLCERIRQEKRRFTQQPVVSAPLPSSIVSLLYLARFAKVPPYSHRIQYHRTIVYTNKWPQTNGPSQKNSGYSKITSSATRMCYCYIWRDLLRFHPIHVASNTSGRSYTPIDGHKRTVLPRKTREIQR